MPIENINGHFKYVPEVHTGSSHDLVMGLAREAESIMRSGSMRLHAQGRELDRISHELTKLGGDLLKGEDEDKGYTLIIEQHLQGCEVKEHRRGVCNCPHVYRFKGCI